ncbi:MAG: type II toxin-antitoxin system PemK/MazF family toxin [Acidobacteriota bacterium]
MITTGLPKNSVANVTQIVAIDRALLVDRVGQLPDVQLHEILSGIELILS